MNKVERKELLHIIKVLQLAIVTYQKNIDMYMESLEWLPHTNVNQKIIKYHGKITDNEILIKKLRHILVIDTMGG